jgi:uncharacterized protein (TIGR03083 family)
MDATADPRAWFATSAGAVVGLVAAIPDDAWERPALGEWTLRELVAHTVRAWSTVRAYLAEPRPAADSSVISASQYLAHGVTVPGVHEGVAQRARDVVGELGDDPAAVVRAVADDVAALVDGEPDERLVPTRFGVLTLTEYLRTRAIELTVHGIDIARASGLELPSDLAASCVPALGLCAEAAGARGLAVPLLDAATGRAALPDDYTLLG